MVVRASALVALLAVVGLAGCSDGGGAADAFDAVDDVDVQATSTTGVIRGVVVDATITPVAGINVSLNNMNRSTTTNEGGAFGFDGLEPGTYFLTASHPDYSQIQQSVEVVAGVNNPDPIRIQVQLIPRAAPAVIPYSATIFVDNSIMVAGSGFTLGGVTTDNSYWFQVDYEDPNNATVVQTEVHWEMVTPMAETARIGGGTYTGNDGVDTGSYHGPTPGVLRANATAGDAVADNVYYNIFAGDSSGAPAGVVANQKYDVIIHVFYNFVPREDWVFSRDGDYQLPS